MLKDLHLKKGLDLVLTTGPLQRETTIIDAEAITAYFLKAPA